MAGLDGPFLPRRARARSRGPVPLRCTRPAVDRVRRAPRMAAAKRRLIAARMSARPHESDHQAKERRRSHRSLGGFPQKFRKDQAAIGNRIMLTILTPIQIGAAR